MGGWGLNSSDEGRKRTMRVFLCVAPPKEEIEALSSFVASLRRYSGFKWVLPEQMHVTLKFLGESEPEAVQRLDSELAKSGSVRAFGIKIAGAGAFPDLTRPKVIWLGVREGAQSLAKLAEGVERAAKHAGFPADGGRFRAHLTLARARESGPLPAGLDGLLAGAPELCWQCDRFYMIKSVLTPKGPVYTPLREYPLG